jgi:hypothetical protein
MKLLRILAISQGIYYLITAVWPILHIESFMWVTGPKFDIWLVKTVSVMILASGLCIFLAGLNRRITPEIVLLAVGCALGLSIIDIYYSFTGTISKIYLLDAVPEIILALTWLIAYFRSQNNGLLNSD